MVWCVCSGHLNTISYQQAAGQYVTPRMLLCSFWTGAAALHMLWPVSGLVWLSLAHIFSLLHRDQDIERQVARRELAIMQASCLARACSCSLLLCSRAGCAACLFT